MYSFSDSQQNLYPDDEEFTACTCQNLPAMLSVLLKAETMRRPAYKKTLPQQRCPGNRVIFSCRKYGE